MQFLTVLLGVVCLIPSAYMIAGLAQGTLYQVLAFSGNKEAVEFWGVVAACTVTGAGFVYWGLTQ